MTHRYPPAWRGRIPVEGQWRHVAPHANLPARVGEEHQYLSGPAAFVGTGQRYGRGIG